MFITGVKLFKLCLYMKGHLLNTLLTFELIKFNPTLALCVLANVGTVDDNFWSFFLLLFKDMDRGVLWKSQRICLAAVAAAICP